MELRYHSFFLQQRHEARGEQRWAISHQQSGNSVVAPSITEAATWIATLIALTPIEAAARHRIEHDSRQILHDR